VSVEIISSTTNQRIKAASSLREARERRDSGLMIVDGYANALHAHAGGLQCTELFIAETSDESHRSTILEWQQLVTDIRINVVAKPAMAKLQYGDRDESLIAIVRQPSVALETLDDRIHSNESSRDHRCFLVLDQVEKPGNLGAIMRTADAAGVTAVLLSDPISETWNPNAIRASLGALFRVPLAIGSAKQVQRWLMDNSISMVAARVDAEQTHTKFQYARETAIVVGNETDGLGSAWYVPDVQAIRIPMFGAIDSLNVSVSTSIVLFELLRQHDRF
jgi:RNA methyltransferase, TrmH family